MFANRRIAVVMPAWNEADKIGRALHAVPAFVDRVVVVDDGSSDGTASVARDHGRPGCEVVVHARNAGVGAAIATGYRRALAAGADLIAVMAGDAQMDPEDLPALLRAVDGGNADYAKGDRFGHRANGAAGFWAAARVMPSVRFVGNLALSSLTRLATGGWRGRDSQCGFTVANRRAVVALLDAPIFARYGYPNAFLVRLLEAGLRVADVPVRPIYGPDWRSGLRPWRVAGPVARLLLYAACGRLARALGVAGRSRAMPRLGTDA